MNTEPTKKKCSPPTKAYPGQAVFYKISDGNFKTGFGFSALLYHFEQIAHRYEVY